MVAPLVMVMLLAAAAIAAPIADSKLTDAARRAIVAATSKVMIENYVYEDSARVFAAKLEEKLEAGRYAKAEDRKEFARMLTQDLLEISNDKHLRVSPLPPPESPVSVDSTGGMRRRVAMAPASVNAGFERVAILDGNVGYVDLRGFQGSDAGRSRCDSMMTAFAGVKAIVVDLRRNRGGDGFMVSHLSSYFFDLPVLLTSRTMRGASRPMESWTSETVPGTRHAKTPLYVLTSDSTFSAGEAFAFGMKTQGRATLIGRPTGGGGHFGRPMPLVEGFSVWMPQGRTYDPKTGKGWQGTGVVPDVAVPEQQALEKALALARGRS